MGTRHKSLVSDDYTRPSNTTAYTAKDAVSDSTSAPTILTFADAVESNGGSGFIVGARLVTDNVTSMTPRLRLHLYHTAVTPHNDNAAFTSLYANRTSRIGFIDFPALQTSGSGSDASYAVNFTDVVPFVGGSTNDIFGLLETLDAFTPASGQKFYVELQIERD